MCDLNYSSATFLFRFPSHAKRKQSGEMTVETTSSDESSSSSTRLSWGWTSAKFITAACLCWNAHSMYFSSNASENMPVESLHHRRLTEIDTTHLPPPAQSSPLASFLAPLYKDLYEREQLFANTPPEEVKYWFEYAGPLQVRVYRSFLFVCAYKVLCVRQGKDETIDYNI